MDPKKLVFDVRKLVALRKVWGGERSRPVVASGGAVVETRAKNGLLGDLLSRARVKSGLRTE